MIEVLVVIHAGLLTAAVVNVIYLRLQKRDHTLADLPMVSILIPARNEEANLSRLLPSIFSQKYPKFEVIVYDDGSEDKTWDVLSSFDDPRLEKIRGGGPPPGWIGKVHALYQATRQANGELLFFLDADAEFRHPTALESIVTSFLSLDTNSVLTGMPALRGGGTLLTSLIPNAILTGLPWPLVRSLPFASVGALNGQCWLLDASSYFALEPHLTHKDEILEDVIIGRYLKANQIAPVLVDLHRDLAVYMYESFRDAWLGFRKNAYLILGGTLVHFIPLILLFIFIYIASPFLSPWFLLSLIGIKGISDRVGRFSYSITLLAPISFLLGISLALDSAFHHWTNRVTWKGRRV